LERRDDEIHVLRIGADADADVAEDPDGFGGVSISEAHSHGTFLRGESTFLDERLRDEIACRTRVEEADGLGAGAKGGSELHEDAAAWLHLLNVLR